MLLAAMLLAGLGSLCAQDFPRQHFTTGDGLPSNTVYYSYRDSKGFLWFATDKGVARYNGIKFETFTTFNGLPDNEVFFFTEDYEGRIWLATYNGELCYYKDGIFHTATNTPFLKLSKQSSFIRHIIVEKDSSVSFLFYEEDRFVNIYKNHVGEYKIDYLKGVNREVSDTGIDYSVVSIEKLDRNRYKVLRARDILFIDIRKGVYDIAKRSEKLTHALMSHNLPYFFSHTKVLNDKQQTIVTFPYATTLLLRAGDLHMYSVYRNSDYTFFSTNKGLYINNSNARVFSDSLNVHLGSSVSNVEQDVDGSYWVATLGNGVYRFDREFHRNQEMAMVYNGVAKYSCVANGNVFFTNDSGNLYKYSDKRAGCLFNYRDYRRPSKMAFVSEPAFLVNNYNQYFSFFNNENIVVDNVLAGKPKVTFYPSKYINGGFKGLFSKGDKSIYGVNLRRLYFIDYNNLPLDKEICKTCTYILNEENNRSRIFSVNQDRDNVLWFGTINAMFKVSGGTSIMQPQFKQAIFKQLVFVGGYLVGFTHNNRLLICADYNRPTIKTVEIPRQECIWEKIYKVNDSSLLISTNNYFRFLVIHPGKEPLYTILIIESALVPIKPESVCADSAYCYFFKEGTITNISIDYFQKSHTSPILRFTQIGVAQKVNPVGPENIVAYSDAKNVKILFSTVSFDSKNVSYQYSISRDGVDNWTDIQTEQINLVNPSYGSYKIKVRAKTLSSGFSKPVVLTLRILRPFWARWWFIGIMVICAGGMIWLVVRRRIAVVLKVREREHDNKVMFMKSEYKALNALMNPHFIFNTLNNVQSLVNRDDKRAANEYLCIFADLIRQNMHNVSNELIPLEKEMHLVSNYLLLEKLRFKENLHYSINVDESVDLSEIWVPPLLIQPLAENSIKHGILPLESAEGTVEVNVFEKGGLLYIEIRDNGVGLGGSAKADDGEHISFGLANIKKRVEQLSVILDKEITFEMSERKDGVTEKRWTVAAVTMPA
jgi:two-component sensor histidine kinase